MNRVIVTTDGQEVRLRPVPSEMIQLVKQAAERELREQGLPLDPPTYTAKTASGDEEVHQHDAESLSTDEERAEWQAYQDATRTLEQEHIRRVTELLIKRGVIADDPPEEWVAEMREFGIEIPDDQRKWRYVTLELLKTPGDVIKAVQAITRISLDGAPREVVDDMVASFRDSMEGLAFIDAETP